MIVREVLEKQLADHFGRFPVGLVVHAQAAFFLDRLPLIVDVLLRDGGRPHAIGLEEKHHVELVCRHLLEVEGVIFVGLPVMVAAVVLDEPGELAIGDVLRALEHQVLEQVREAGAALSARSATPTLYATATDTTGAARSGETMTRSPFFSRVSL